MKIAQIKRRIQRAEDLCAGRQAQAAEHLQQMKQAWHAGWTPARIIVAGLGLGFVTGCSKPASAVGGLASKLASAPKLLQLLSAASALLGAVQSQAVAAADAPAPAPDVPAASAAPAAAATPAPPTPGAKSTPAAAPAPAEAATDLSEA